MDTLFSDIILDTPQGVSAPGFDTRLLVEHLQSLPQGSLFDVGTGTGCVAIAMAKKGWKSTASDIHEHACVVTQENAKKNNVTVTVFQSNLFENVSGEFDYIVFNPPYGSSSSHGAHSFLEWIKSFIPRENDFFAGLAFFVVRSQRKKIIKRFLGTVSPHFSKQGTVLLLLHHSEVTDVLNQHSGDVVGESKWMRLVSIPKTSF